MRKVLVGFGLAAIAALALGACGGGDDNKAAEELANKLTGGSIDVNLDEDGSGTIDVGGEDGGSISVGGTELPEDLKDFPLPDDSEITSSYSSSGMGSSGSVVSVAANGDYKEVAADTQSGLEDAGFTISGTYTAESDGVGTASFAFEGNGTSGTVGITEDSAATEGYNLSITIITSQDASTETTSG